MPNPTDTIRIGLMAPLTGLVELYGPEITLAGRIAADEINAAGGILGRRLELIVIDDGSLPGTAVPAAEKLIDDYGCIALIGNLLSNSRISVSAIVSEPRRIPYLNFSFYEGSIHGRYFFHFAALPNQQIDKMIPYMAAHFGHKMFFAGSNYEWPRGSIDAAKRALRHYGGEIVGEAYLPIGSQEIDDLLNKVASSCADVFVPYFAGNDQIHLLKRFTELGLKSRMAVVMGHYDEAMVGSLSPEVREGFYSSNTYFMSLDTPANKHYLDLLAARPEINGVWPKGNGVLTNFGEGTYLCVHAFAKAAVAAGGFDTEALVNALEHIEVSGPQGRVIMDAATHHASVNAYLSRCNADGTFRIIESFGLAAPKIPLQYRRSTTTDSIATTATALANIDQATAQKILSITDTAVIVVNQQGTVLSINQSAERLFGYEADELIDRSVNILLPPKYRELHARNIEMFASSPALQITMGRRGEISGYKKDGSLFPASATLSKIMTPQGWILVATIQDISEHKKIEEDLLWRATHDPLTDLPNRALLYDRLENALKRAEQQRHGVGLLFIDLDDFKLVNDCYGHSVGDDLLKITAKILVSLVRPGDTVSRFGGDEFVILCDQIDSSAIYPLADRINLALRQPIELEANHLFSTASIGVVHVTDNEYTPEEILRNADSAMYRAKEHGRDGWKTYDNELSQRSREHLTISTNLRRALERDEFSVRYQPIMDATGSRIAGAELLLRWHPEQGEVSPVRFIPIAESTGTILAIGNWVFQQACIAETQWRQRFGTQAPYVSVNLSTRQLNDSNLVANFSAILPEHHSDPSRILLEITETALMADASSNLKVLQQLAELGLHVAVDDFGTGYSSLIQLLRMPVNSVKVDREFVDGLGLRNECNAIVTAVISMAHALGLQVIAEGVETQDQLAQLQAMGCDYFQGYLFDKPLLEEQFLGRVASHSS